jgi:hypothetical protein
MKMSNPADQALQMAQNMANQNLGLATQQLAHTQAMDAIHRVDEIRQENEIARLKAALARANQELQERSSRPGESEDQIYAREKAQGEAARAKAYNQVLLAAIEERDGIVVEWMQSNETFKRLAREYGKMLGLSDEQRTNNYLQMILNVASEDPKYESTALTQKVKLELNPQSD